MRLLLKSSEVPFFLSEIYGSDPSYTTHILHFSRLAI